MRSGHPMWLAAILVSAVVCLFVGWASDGDSYGESVFGNLGTTLLLFLPLFWLERVLERRVAEVQKTTGESIDALGTRIEDVQASVSDVSSRLDEIGRQTTAGITRRREEDLSHAVGPARAARDNPSFETIYDALLHAYKLRATGLDVFVPERDAKLTMDFGVRPVEDRHVAISAISHDNYQLYRGDSWKHRVRYTWKPSESIEDFSVNFDSEIRRTWGATTPEVNATGVLGWLFDTLELAAQIRHLSSESDWEKPKTIELATKHWLVTAKELRHIEASGASFSKEEVTRGARWAPEMGALQRPPHVEELADAWAEAYERYTES